MVRAKFTCVKNQQNGESAHIRFEPVCDGSAENKEFFKWTPGGVIEIGCANSAATAQFKEGQEYYVDFTAASKS